eukprot:3466370-Amphidinium_carterae.1
MPWPDQAKASRQRSQSRGLTWADQSEEEETGVSSSSRRMAGSAWKPTEESVAGMRPTFYYLSHRMEPIPLASTTGWATDANVEWPPLGEPKLHAAYALEVRKILVVGLNEFEAIPDGEPQWNFEAQDCFQGRERTARAEGHLADGSAMWPCGGNLE